MNATTDLERLERTAWRKFYGDGLFDMYLGGMFVILPLAGPLDDAFGSTGLALVLVSYLLLLAAYGTLRHFVIRPRIGTFKPAPSRKRKIGFARLVLSASVIVGLFALWLVTLGPGPETIANWIPIAWFVNCVVVFGAMAYFLDIPRFYVWGVLLGSSIMVDELVSTLFAVDMSPFVIFGVPGLVLFGWGLVMFVRFLREYPIIHAEELPQ